jgi:hypothetical protein
MHPYIAYRILMNPANFTRRPDEPEWNIEVRRLFQRALRAVRLGHPS